MSKLSLTDEQKQIIESDANNIIISACAGSGKSSTLVFKALEEVKRNNSWKYLSILTFTNKSKQDLEKKLSSENILITTFHGFIYNNIFPFDSKISANFDENFSYRASTYEEWLGYLYSNNTLVGSRGRNDFTIQHALILMKRSNLLSYLKSKFQALYIDEAQDNNYYQYDFLEIIIRLGVKVLMVGDPNQTLYQFRGATPDQFIRYCADDRFESFKLSRNFRCHYIINDLANGYKFIDYNIIDDNGFGYYVIEEVEINNIVSEHISESIVFLRKTNASLSDCGNKFSILKDLAFDADVSEIVKITVTSILKIKFQSNYYLYNLFEDLKIDVNSYTNKTQDEIRLQIESFLVSQEKVNLEDFLFKLSLSELIDDVYNTYQQLVDDPITKNFFSNVNKHVTMTIHSSKGLEFDNVIIDKNDFFYRQKIEENNFYVAFTRAKKRIFVIN